MVKNFYVKLQLFFKVAVWFKKGAAGEGPRKLSSVLTLSFYLLFTAVGILTGRRS